MKVLLQSYLNNNLGDDLMIDYVCRRYPNHDFYVANTNSLTQVACTNDNLHIIKSITPVKKQVIKRAFNKIISFLKIPKINILIHFIFHHYDLNLELGGSIFMQVTDKSWINKVRDANYILKKCQKNIIVNSNFGPYNSETFKNEHEKLFQNYDLILWRDNYSLNLFHKKSNMKCYPDLIFNYSIPKRQSKNGKIGISVISLQNVGIRKYAKEYLDGMIQLVNKLSEVYQVSLISFCENEGDLDTCQKIFEGSSAPENRIEIFNHVNVCKTLTYLSLMDGMVCTRFHANVIAICLNIPFVPVIYSKKITNMLTDIKYKGYLWEIMKGNPIDTMRAVTQLKDNLSIDRTLIKEAYGHIKYLDYFLSC